MLFSKEDYYNQMYTLHQCQSKVSEAEFNPNLMSRLNKELTQQQLVADTAEKVYSEQIKKVNLQVDQIRTKYKGMLNKMQEYDDQQINFMKYNLMKFAQIVDSVGKAIHDRGENLSETADMVNSATDIKIFIDHHKSTNLVVNKERFMIYDDQ